MKPLRHEVSANLPQQLLTVLVSEATASAALEQLDQLIARLPGLLDESGIRLAATHCGHCGQPGCDTYSVTQGLVRPAHSACNSQRAGQLVWEIQHNQLSGIYGLTAVAALGGAIAGAIPAFISLYFFDYLIGLLFALIPLAAAFAYRRTGGIRSRMMPVILSLISVVVSAGLALLSIYMTINAEVRGYLGGNLPLDLFFELLRVPELQADFLGFFGQVALFCGLGIFFAWSGLKKTNRSSIQELDGLPVSEAAVIPERPEESW